jgi:ribonucleoside-triphosphate reductase
LEWRAARKRPTPPRGGDARHGEKAKQKKAEEQTMTKCGGKCEVYSRVCGYFRPVSNWNKGKKEEFKDRKTYSVGDKAAEKVA